MAVLTQNCGPSAKSSYRPGNPMNRQGRAIEPEIQRIRILVVEDHHILREGIVALFKGRAQFEVIGAAENGRKAIEAYATLKPDVVLMDLQMPVLGGVDAIGGIIRLAPLARIVVLTTFDGDEDVYRAITAGAKAFIVKDAPVEELVRTVEEVASGRYAIAQHAIRKLSEHSQNETLTAREIDVLELLAAGRANLEIARELDISLGTVRTHVSHVMDKLGANSRTHAVVIATQRGLLRRQS